MPPLFSPEKMAPGSQTGQQDLEPPHDDSSVKAIGVVRCADATCAAYNQWRHAIVSVLWLSVALKQRAVAWVFWLLKL